MTKFLGRAPTSRGSRRSPGDATGTSLSSACTRVVSHLGPVQARSARQPFHFPLLTRVASRASGLQGVMPGSSVRTLSTPDAQALRAGVFGERVWSQTGISFSWALRLYGSARRAIGRRGISVPMGS